MSIFFFFAVTCISLNSSFFFILASYIGVFFFLCFHSLFLSIWFPFAFFQTFFNKVLHMKFHLSLYGNPIRPAERAPYETLAESWQDSHQRRIEYHMRYINYIVTMPGSSTWSLMQLLVFPLCNNLLKILADKSWQKFTFYILTSVCVFSIMFSIHFLRRWEGEFV